MIIDTKSKKIFVVQNKKPIPKKKQVKFIQDPLTGESGKETETVSDESGKLDLSILESENLDKIHLNYKTDDF